MRHFPIDGTFDEQTRWWIENNADVIDRGIARGQTVKPITTWAEVAAFVDDAVWERILGDLGPKSRAEALACRPCKAYPTPDAL
ncbi:hypothetical protein ABT369_38625 [Dactylosporangium sp. NPDC000244]|uniref:hypothetical protein n=1 Tax=Dactylosporangium sp. NPDC000244 TaxID=3154365 RepID=UPI00332731D7